MPQAEFDKESTKDYEAIILAHPSKAATPEEKSLSVKPLMTPRSKKKISKISVDDLTTSIIIDKGLSKTETQKHILGVATESQSLDAGPDKAN